MDHPVIFLVLACELMLLDLAFGIIIGVSAHYKTILCPSVHCLGVYVVVWFLILYQPSLFLPCLEVLDSLVISWLAVLVNDRVEVYLRLCDVEKRLLTGFSLGFCRVQYIIWPCSHFLDILLRRTYRRERSDSYHDYLFT